MSLSNHRIIYGFILLWTLVAVASLVFFYLRQVKKDNRDVCINVPEVVLIPAGYFTMGSDEGNQDEVPVHTVYLDSYYIGKYEVTNAQYYQFWITDGGESSHHTPRYFRDADNWSDFALKMPDYPVAGVSWYDAKAYCDWLSQVTDENYRLLTEAEWEKAASWNDVTKEKYKWPWGNKWDASRLNCRESGIGGPTPIGSFPTGISPYGCFDMAGNICEWVWDWHSENYYSHSPVKNPKNTKRSIWKTLRGCSWRTGILRGYSLRCALRHNYYPDEPSELMGFRIAKDY